MREKAGGKRTQQEADEAAREIKNATNQVCESGGDSFKEREDGGEDRAEDIEN